MSKLENIIKKNLREKKLEKLITYHKKLYYKGQTEISDIEFDNLENELKQINPNSNVLNLVGSINKKVQKVSHKDKMLSLLKTYDIEELFQWIGDSEVVATFKVDGNSCSLIYKDNLDLAKTRGNGIVGENITKHISWINSIPKTLNFKEEYFKKFNLNQDYTFEVRGELYCNEENFLKLSEEMHSRKLDRPNSPRNIVAGLIGRKDQIDLCSFVDFLAYDLIIRDARDNRIETEVFDLGKENISKEIDKFNFLKKLGFNIPDVMLIDSKKDIISAIEKTKKFFTEGNYEIDGIVFSYNELSKHLEMGETAHHPRYKMAYKFKGETKTSTILRIDWQVSRNGIITPVAKIVPINISGAIISNVTLHNWGQVVSHELKEGDTIEIIRSGEVIPKYLRTIHKSEEKLTWPTLCPSCHLPTKIYRIRLLCINSNCFAQKLEEILHFIKNMDIENFSKQRVSQLMKAKKLNTISDLYKLRKQDLMELDFFQDTLANKIINSINNSKHVSLAKFLSALGIKGGGYNKCQDIIKFGYNSMEKILKLSSQELMQVEGFAKLSAESFINSLNSKRELTNELLENDFSFSVPIFLTKALSFCVTGSLSFSRNKFKELVIKNGFDFKSTTTKTLDYLVVSNETFLGMSSDKKVSSKLQKAKKMNIKIISEDKFLDLLEK